MIKNILIMAVMSFVILIGVADSLQAVIPVGNMIAFFLNTGTSGGMVSVDAVMLQIALFPLMLLERPNDGWATVFSRWIVIILMITAMHYVCGITGLYLSDFGVLMSKNYLSGFIWVLLTLTCWAGTRFVVMVRIGGEDDMHDKARQLVISILSVSAFLIYYLVSGDEFFAVLQRYQWMVAQGWDHDVMAASISLSMVWLFGIMTVVLLLLMLGRKLHILTKNEDAAMFWVCTLIMYYMIRAVFQNGIGLIPWEIPKTGIAPLYLAAGYIAMKQLDRALENERFKLLACRFLLIKNDEPEEQPAI